MMADTENKMRLFIGVPLGESASAVLDNWAKQAQRQWAFSRWVHPADYHITLQFLGDTPESKLATLLEELNRTAARSAPFRLALGGRGTFGLPSSPRVLWAAVDGDIDRLHELHHQVLKTTAPLGFMPEARPYRPHITLARKYKGTTAWDPGMLEADTSGAAAEWTADRFCLFQTHMQAMPMYERLGEFRLSGTSGS
ncbi:RNA 2',3'-cyclic phosphodiesterase [Paenibacillus dendritiformis]|uniref:RNA 2',3'-cyclic phosphodiesterase n=1 Tax=Paenibacillus dendritiformis TaxID=130049 RepID=UPI000DA91AE8|nr:RNA 2',3'-cyclic phosphodiesterase [Paenibacillus dendritiformis]PZM66601.1 RNA 2',3'-cyclic phosphodiesterase [Paenibacillus dendritiformis]